MNDTLQRFDDVDDDPTYGLRENLTNMDGLWDNIEGWYLSCFGTWNRGSRTDSWCEIIFGPHKLYVFGSANLMILIMIKHGEWVRTLRIWTGCETTSRDDIYLVSGLGTGVFGQIRGAKSFLSIISSKLFIETCRWCWWWSIYVSILSVTISCYAM